MNAEMIVAPHPYYAVTDETGQFELNDVPPGHYEVVAWHEGWHELRRETALDVFTQKPVPRAIFSEPRTWEQSTDVIPHVTSSVNFIKYCRRNCWSRNEITRSATGPSIWVQSQSPDFYATERY